MASSGIKVVAVALLMLVGTAAGMTQGLSEVSEGDLFFIVHWQGNNITEVTAGDLPIDHVAIAHRIGGNDGLLYAIEAIDPIVTLTPIDTLLRRTADDGDSLMVARVQGIDARATTARALQYVGRPYDHLYLPDDKEIYCSELVQLACVDCSGRQIFDTQPMSFHDISGNITPYWTEFYHSRGLTVPEGEPGTNPASLYAHPRVTIVTQH